MNTGSARNSLCDLGQMSKSVSPPCHNLQVASGGGYARSQDPRVLRTKGARDQDSWNEEKRVVINLKAKISPLRAETSRQELRRKE